MRSLAGKRPWILVLLVSLGLNLALARGMIARGDSRADSGASGRAFTMDTLSPADSAKWWGVMERRSRGMARKMGLDTSENHDFLRMRMESLPQMRRLRLDILAARQRLHEEFLQPELETEIVRELATELTQAQSRLDSLVIESIIREMSTLTPEQRVHYLSQMPLHKGRDHQSGHRSGHGPGQGMGRGRGGGRQQELDPGEGPDHSHDDNHPDPH